MVTGLEEQAKREQWSSNTMSSLLFLPERKTDEAGRLYPTSIVYHRIRKGNLIGFVSPNTREGRVEIPLAGLESVHVLTPLTAVMLLDSFRRNNNPESY